MNKVSIGFTIISGLGWVLDLVVMTMLVHVSCEPGLANLVSASMAASLVYWTSRKYLFKKDFGLAASGGFVFYLAYTAVVVALFSLLIQYSTIIMHDNLINWGYPISLAVVAFAAKVFYTPFNLGLNYIVSCNLAKRF